MNTNELVALYKGKPLKDLFQLFDKNFPQFQEFMAQYTYFQLQSDSEHLLMFLDAIYSVDHGIETEEIELLELIYSKYLPDLPLPTLDLLTRKQELSGMFETFTELIESIFPSMEIYLGDEPDRSEESKDIMLSVFFSCFYANGVLDSKQKAILKRIEGLTPPKKETTAKDLPSLMSNYKAKPMEELVDIFSTSVLEIAALYDRIFKGMEDFNNEYLPDTVFDYFVLPVIGLDGSIDEEEYEFLKGVNARISSQPMRTLEDLTKEVDNSHNRYADTLLPLQIKAVKILEGLYSGAIELYLKTYLSAFASNRSFDSRQKEILRLVLDPSEEPSTSPSTTSAPTSTAPVTSSGNSVSNASDGKPVDVQVLDFGATNIEDDGRYTLSVGVQIHNSNKFHQANRVKIKINVLDDNGRVIESDNDTIYHIDPDTIFNYGTEININHGSPSTIQVYAVADSYSSSPSGSKIFDGIDITDYSFVDDEWRGYAITGQATSRYTKKIDYTSVYLLFLDGDNKIKGGSNFSFSDLFSGVTEGFTEHVAINLSQVKFIRSSIDMS